MVLVVSQASASGTPAVIVASATGGAPLTLAEGGASVSYAIELGSQPTAPVTIDISTLGGQASVSPATVTFTTSDWMMPQPVVVTAIDDQVAEMSPHADTLIHTANSSDPAYASISVPDLQLLIADNDTPGIRISDTGLGTFVTEGGSSDIVEVTLDTQPTSMVSVALSGSQVVPGTPTLTFSPSNWNLPQPVTVNAIDDAVHEGPHSGYLDALAGSSDPMYAGVSAPRHTVFVDDNDTAGVIVTPPSPSGLSEATPGIGATYGVRLQSQPTAAVSVSVQPDPQVSTSIVTLTFSPANWNVDQQVTIYAVDDLVSEPSPHPGTVNHTVASVDPDYDTGTSVPPVTVSITDNDGPGIVVIDPPSFAMSEADPAGSERRIGMRLTMAPAGLVTIRGVSDGQVLLEGTSAITFSPTNWFLVQELIVRAVDDTIAEPAQHPGVLSFIVTAPTALAYDGMAIGARTFDIADDDLANASIGCVAGPDWILNGGGHVDASEQPSAPNHDIGCYMQLGTTPTADVTIAITTSPGSQLVSDQASITVAAGTQGYQLVTFTAVDDDIAEPSPHFAQISYAVTSADPVYGAMTIPQVQVDIADNDTTGVAFDSTGAIAVAEGGATARLGVKLTSQPSAPVTVSMDPGTQATVTPASMTFTSANWKVLQYTTIAAVDDPIDEADVHPGSIFMTVSSSDPGYASVSVPPLSLNIADNDTPGVLVTATGTGNAVSESGGTDTLSVRLATRPGGDVIVSIRPDMQLTASAVLLTFTAADWNIVQSVTIGAVQDAKIEGEHTGYISFAVDSTDSGYAPDSPATPKPALVSISDDDPAGVVLIESDGGTKIVEGGATDSYTIALAGQPSGDVTVKVDGGSRVTPSPAQVTFTSTNWNVPQTVTLTAVQDTIDSPDAEAITVRHSIVTDSGGWTGVQLPELSVTVLDDDLPTVVIAQPGGSTKVTEGGASDTILVSLSARPTTDVSLVIGGKPQLAIDDKPITFNAQRWSEPFTVEVKAIDDAAVEGDHDGKVAFQIVSTDSSFSKVVVPTLAVSITDNDHEGESGGGTEDGTTIVPRGGTDPTGARPTKGLGGSTSTSTNGRITGTTGPATSTSDRTNLGATRTDLGLGRTVDGKGTDPALEPGATLDGQLVSAKHRARRPRRPSPPGPVVQATAWVQHHWKQAAPVAGIGTVLASAGAVMLGNDPSKLAQRSVGSKVAKRAAREALRHHRHTRPRLRGRKKRDDEDEEDADELDGDDPSQ